jgi:hypothetical protein
VKIYMPVPFKNNGKYMVEELLTSSKKRLNKLKDVIWKNEIDSISTSDHDEKSFGSNYGNYVTVCNNNNHN